MLSRPALLRNFDGKIRGRTVKNKKVGRKNSWVYRAKQKRWDGKIRGAYREKQKRWDGKIRPTVGK